MSLNLKTICSWNIHGKPFADNIYNNISVWNQYIKDQIDTNDNDGKSLKILCVQGLYGYRSGLLGKVFDYIGYNLSRCFNPTLTSFLINTESNDFELFTLLVSTITRILPLYNYNVIDPKYLLNTLGFANDNYSMTGMFDFKSLFLLKPFYDSGCAIYANRKYKYCGFEKWNSKNGYANKGMTWCYFECLYSLTGITVINLDFNENNTDLEDIDCLYQILSLKNMLEDKYILRSINSYETYIVGNFNIPFNASNIICNIRDKLQILQNAGLIVLNDNYKCETTEFILYNKYNMTEIVEHNDLTTSPLNTKNNMFYKINKIQKNYNCGINPIFINSLKSRLKEIDSKKKKQIQELEEIKEDEELEEVNVDVEDQEENVEVKDKDENVEVKYEDVKDEEVKDEEVKEGNIEVKINFKEGICIKEDYFVPQNNSSDEWEYIL
jgi:hypothetical protein